MTIQWFRSVCNRIHKGGFRQSEIYIRNLTVRCYHSLMFKYWHVYIYMHIYFVNRGRFLADWVCKNGQHSISHLTWSSAVWSIRPGVWLSCLWIYRVDFCDSLVMIEIQWSNTGWTLEFVEKEPYRFLLILLECLLSGHSISTQLWGCEKPKPPREILCRCSGSQSQLNLAFQLSQSRCQTRWCKHFQVRAWLTYSLWTKSSLQAAFVRPVR